MNSLDLDSIQWCVFTINQIKEFKVVHYAMVCVVPQGIQDINQAFAEELKCRVK